MYGSYSNIFEKAGHENTVLCNKNPNDGNIGYKIFYRIIPVKVQNTSLTQAMAKFLGCLAKLNTCWISQALVIQEANQAIAQKSNNLQRYLRPRRIYEFDFQDYSGYLFRKRGTSSYVFHFIFQRIITITATLVFYCRAAAPCRRKNHKTAGQVMEI